jgi:murein DD-endopeptidase MepM/ murein hydrolase activator NlpD
MTHFWTRASVIALAGAALGACTTPQYPLEAGQPRGAPLTMPTPNFPIVPPADQPMAAQSAAAPAVTAPTATAPVESQALPPPSGTTVTAPTAVASQPLAPLAPPPPQMVPTTVTETTTVPVAAGRVVTVQGKPETYVVRKGDHVDAIARKLGTTRRQLARDNDLKSPYRLHPGDRLVGPSTTAKAYVVESGDTLYAVARRFSVTPGRLADVNDISATAGLRTGQKLTLPKSYKDVGPGKRTVTTTRTVMKPAPAPAPSAVQTVTQSQTPAPVSTTPAPTTISATTTTTVPAPKPYMPPVYTAPPAPKPYTPPATAIAPAPRPYTPPMTTAPISKPYSPSPSPYAPPTTSSVPPIVQSSAPPTDAEVAAAGAGRFVQPVTGTTLSSFGPMMGGQRNDGIDIAAPAGTPVRSAAAGEVVYAGDQVPGCGNLVLVKHDGGWVTAYAHLGRVDVKMRDRVMQGQEIGQVGSTGGVSQPQLHFEVRYAPTPQDKARPIDPQLVLPH